MVAAEVNPVVVRLDPNLRPPGVVVAVAMDAFTAPSVNPAAVAVAVKPDATGN
mgnify:CR=1 FL=1